MSRAVRIRACFLAALVTCVIAVGGCGSSASTSPQEAHAIAVAEAAFLKEWRNAEKNGAKRCASIDGRVARQRCLVRFAEPGKFRAAKRFQAELEGSLEKALGSQCAEAVEEAIHTIPSVPSFAGTTTAACRADSQG
jgi:hypothetical protein